MSIAAALERQRQEDGKFEVSLAYREGLCLKNDVDKTGFELQRSPPSASRVLELKGSPTRPATVCF